MNPPRAPLYDGHIEKRINANEYQLNPHHDHVKLVAAQTHGMNEYWLQVHSKFTKIFRILYDYLYVVYSSWT